MTTRNTTRRLRLLTRSSRERGGQLELIYWGVDEHGPVRLRFTEQEAVFFVERTIVTRAGRRRPLELETLDGQPVDGVYFSTRRELLDERDRLRALGTWPCEADLRPQDRFLMERFITAGVEVHGTPIDKRTYVELVDPEIGPCEVEYTPTLLSFDIETDGLEGPLLSIAVAGHGGERVWIASTQPSPKSAVCLATEKDVIEAFIRHVQQKDPDVLIGWNVVDFDLDYLQTRCERLGVGFTLGRGRRVARVLPPRGDARNAIARVPGRQVMDGMGTLRAATWTFERYGLDHVANELLGRGKTITWGGGDKVAEIRRLHREDLSALAHYNLEDARLVLEIFAKARLLDFALERQRLTGLSFSRRAGAVTSFDHLYLPRLHREGYVAPDVGASGLTPSSPGGYVMDSMPGLYEHVLVLDFKSLYPSIIRTFLIDPLGLALATSNEAADDAVPGFDGGRFHRERHIVPGLIEMLWNARDAAKRDNNKSLSTAIKILMNSFYGVLGTPVCRFFDPRLASSITRRGHQVLQDSRAFIEAQGYPVIYGDTDSLFVHLGNDVAAADCPRVGRELTARLNDHWTQLVKGEFGLDSALELEFETHFSRFLMPTMRGSSEGSKKRYAGLVRDEAGNERLIFKGLEVVRTDWTRLARDFQRELVRRVFYGEPFASWVRQVSDDLLAGRLDDRLVYRKRLRRRLSDYTRTAPPHVAAARMLDKPTRHVEYVITRRGPRPVNQIDAPLDYDHYLQRQLAPAAEAILPFVGTSFAKLGGRQLSLF